MNKFAILGGAALLAIAGAGLAQGPDGPRRDRDADVTRQQAIARADAMFARLDANHDGRFTPDEAGQAGQARRAEAMGRMFDRLDANHDGNISRDEFAQAHAMRGPGGAGGPDGPGMGMRHRMGPPPGGADMGPPPPGGPEGPRGPGMRGGRLFGAEGFVTAEQFRARALARFDRADADRNGILTTAERQAAHGQMHGPMRPRMGEPMPNDGAPRPN
jgi:hypothetical protein